MMEIQNAKLEDIGKIVELEKRIEKENAATKETIISRFGMLLQGFYVAVQDDEIVGYIESCLWDRDDFETFDEIKDFPKHHDPNGKTLYIIFLGVDEDYRRKGIGSELVRTLQKYASERLLDKVQVVAGEGFLTNFYKDLGFEVVRELPRFLPYSSGTLMEYDIQ